MDMVMMKEFAQLENDKNKLEAKLKDIKQRTAEIMPVIMEHMLTDEIDHITMNGRTIFIQKSIFARYENRYDAIQALKKAGWTDYVNENFNANQLSARLRELDKEGQDLPPEFDGVIEKNEIYKVKSRKA